MAAGEVDLRVVGALDGDAGNSLGRERVVRTAIAAIERSRTAYGVRDIALGAIGLDGSGGIGKRTVVASLPVTFTPPSSANASVGKTNAAAQTIETIVASSAAGLLITLTEQSIWASFVSMAGH